MTAAKFLLISAFSVSMCILLNETSWVQGANVANSSSSGSSPPERQSEDSVIEDEKTASLSLYGKVIDQNSNPVQNAQVDVGVLGYDSSGNLRLKVVPVMSDPRGNFSVHNLSGIHISVGEISKENYAFEPAKTTIQIKNAKLSNKRNPLIFHMRKKGNTSFIIESPPKELELSPEKSPFELDVFNTQISFGPTKIVKKSISHLLVKLKFDKKLHTWTFRFRGSNKGDQLMLLNHPVFHAPETGYHSSEQVVVSRKIDPNMPQRGNVYPHPLYKDLIFKSSVPKTYVRIKIELYCYDTGRSNLSYTLFINPYGDKTFEKLDEIFNYPSLFAIMRLKAIRALNKGKTASKPDFKELIKQYKKKLNQRRDASGQWQ